ncbi:MAG: hypothetical protein K8H88_25355, partial [Sandaracinaceae bacterium]|nr:hypothetical protein [Sandaracinaceae bacterium]
MDNTPPRNRLIAFYTLLSVILLASLKPLLDVYFDVMVRRAQESSLSTANDLAPVEHERGRWAQRSRRIDEAIEQIGQQGRSSDSRLRPQPSDNFDAVRGWGVLAPPAPAAPAPTAPTTVPGTEPVVPTTELAPGTEPGTEPA